MFLIERLPAISIILGDDPKARWEKKFSTKVYEIEGFEIADELTNEIALLDQDQRSETVKSWKIAKTMEAIRFDGTCLRGRFAGQVQKMWEANEIVL